MFIFLCMFLSLGWWINLPLHAWFRSVFLRRTLGLYKYSIWAWSCSVSRNSISFDVHGDAKLILLHGTWLKILFQTQSKHRRNMLWLRESIDPAFQFETELWYIYFFLSPVFVFKFPSFSFRLAKFCFFLLISNGRRNGLQSYAVMNLWDKLVIPKITTKWGALNTNNEEVADELKVLLNFLIGSRYLYIAGEAKIYKELKSQEYNLSIVSLLTCIVQCVLIPMGVSLFLQLFKLNSLWEPDREINIQIQTNEKIECLRRIRLKMNISFVLGRSHQIHYWILLIPRQFTTRLVHTNFKFVSVWFLR